MTEKTEFSNAMLVFRQPETEFTVQEADRLCVKSLGMRLLYEYL